MKKEVILSYVEEAQILGILKNICLDFSNSVEKNKLRNILAASSDKNYTLNQLIKRKYLEELSSNQIERLTQMVIAFLKKSNYRKNISIELKNKLLKAQNYKCALCQKEIDISGHADHIVPFKYVGDELEDNMQMLCSNCNKRKNDSIDYQIRFLLKLI